MQTVECDAAQYNRPKGNQYAARGRGRNAVESEYGHFWSQIAWVHAWLTELPRYLSG